MEGIWQDYPTKVSILEAIALAGKDAAHMRPGSSSSDIQKLGRGLLQALDHWRDGIIFAFEMCKYITPFIVSQSYSFHLELPSLLLSPIRHFSTISPANDE